MTADALFSLARSTSMASAGAASASVPSVGRDTGSSSGVSTPTNHALSVARQDAVATPVTPEAGPSTQPGNPTTLLLTPQLLLSRRKQQLAGSASDASHPATPA